MWQAPETWLSIVPEGGKSFLVHTSGAKVEVNQAELITCVRIVRSQDDIRNSQGH